MGRGDIDVRRSELAWGSWWYKSSPTPHIGTQNNLGFWKRKWSLDRLLHKNTFFGNSFISKSWLLALEPIEGTVSQEKNCCSFGFCLYPFIADKLDSLCFDAGQWFDSWIVSPQTRLGVWLLNSVLCNVGNYSRMGVWFIDGVPGLWNTRWIEILYFNPNQ